MNNPSNSDHRASLDDILKMCVAMLSIPANNGVNMPAVKPQIDAKTVEIPSITADDILAKMKAKQTK